MIALPPVEPGGSQFTVACVLPGVAVGVPGALGSETAVTELDAAEAGLSPFALVAFTVNVYAVPTVRPETTVLVAVPFAAAVMPPGLDVTVWLVIVLPPVEPMVHTTVIWPEPGPATAVPMVGAPGTPEGVTELDAFDAAPTPTALVAVTVKVYAVPFESPVTVAEVAEAPTVAVKPPGLDVAVNPVIALPPLKAGAVKLIVACVLPGVAVPMVGALGTVAGVTADVGFDASLAPAALFAFTVNV